MNKNHQQLQHENRFETWLKDKDVSLITGCYKRSIGGKSYYSFIKQKNSQGNRGVVFTAHGTGNSAFYPFIKIFKHLIGLGFSIYTFDLDGHGVKSSTKISEHSVQTCIPQALEELKRLVNSEDKISFLGHRLGGSLILDHLMKNPNLKSNSIIISSPLYFKFSITGFVNELKSPLDKVFWQETRHYGLKGIFPALGPFKRDQFPIRMDDKNSNHRSYISLVSNILDGLFHDSRLEELSQVQSPILYVYGHEDKIAPVEHGRKLAVQTKKGALITVDHANHFNCIFSDSIIEGINNWYLRDEFE